MKSDHFNMVRLMVHSVKRPSEGPPWLTYWSTSNPSANFSLIRVAPSSVSTSSYLVSDMRKITCLSDMFPQSNLALIHPWHPWWPSLLLFLIAKVSLAASLSVCIPFSRRTHLRYEASQPLLKYFLSESTPRSLPQLISTISEALINENPTAYSATRLICASLQQIPTSSPRSWSNSGFTRSSRSPVDRVPSANS